MTKTRFTALVIVGIILVVLCHIGLKEFTHIAVPDPKHAFIPTWYALSQPLVAMLASLLPAFVVGCAARQSGFALGALVGFFSALVIAALFGVAWQNVSFSSVNLVFCANFIMWALPSTVLSSVSAAAGQLAASGLPSNYSVNRTLTR